jgi:hypothetical protein
VSARKPTPAAIVRALEHADAPQLAQALLDLGWDVSLKRPKWWLAEEKRKAKATKSAAKSGPVIRSASFSKRGQS